MTPVFAPRQLLLHCSNKLHPWRSYAGFAGAKTGLALHFSPTETTQAYMETLNQQLDKHGRPVAIYSDKHSILSERN